MNLDKGKLGATNSYQVFDMDHPDHLPYYGDHSPVDSSIPDLYNSSSTTQLYNGGNPRKDSVGHISLEALPTAENYEDKVLGRPSLGVVHGEIYKKKKPTFSAEEEHEHGGHIKLGWIQGCLIQCILNIWGVMLFLRLSWIVGQSGIWQSLIVIGIATVVCVITTLSLSAISTNGEVKGGGIYYLISRSIGPEFGASVGLVFAFANAVAAAMNTIGFCASLNSLLALSGYKIIDNGDNDTRIVGVVAIAIMCVVCVVGMDYEVMANDLFLIVISGAILDFLVGAAIGPSTDLDRAQGFSGFSTQLFAENFNAEYVFSEGMDQSIITIFGIFFPSVTGIQAGANISGDLKNAAEAIPKGTLLSLLITMISYALFVLFAGGAAVRDASGVLSEYYDGTYRNCTGRVVPCAYGLHNDYSVMQLLSGSGYLIYAGCFAATLSTALTNVLSVPKILQALGNDKVYPGFQFWSKGYFKSQEPLRGYVLTYFISSAFVLIANLNAIAPLIANFYLVSYGMINYCTFHAEHVKPIGWRPSFKYYNKWVSLFGFLICVVIMFILNWITALITFIIIIILYMGVVYRKPDINWGASTQAQNYKTVLHSTHMLTASSEHVKTYLPQILVLCGNLQHRPPLVDLANLITKHNSLLLCGEVSEKPLTNDQRQTHYRHSYDYLHANKIKAFYTLVDGMGFEQGCKALIQTAGIGKFSPNVLMIGYKADWRVCSPFDLNAYFNVLHEAFDNRMAVSMVRLPDGINFSTYVKGSDDEDIESDDDMSISKEYFQDMPPDIDIRSGLGMFPADSNVNLQPIPRMMVNGENISVIDFKGNSQFSPPRSPADLRKSFYFNTDTLSMDGHKSMADLNNDPNAAKKAPELIPVETVLSMKVFRQKHRKEIIDVWWLYDDGGLTILLPHIISLRKAYTGCKVRIFALAQKVEEIDIEERNMANLLTRFRIDYHSLIMIKGFHDKPKESTLKKFHKLVNNYKKENNEGIQVTDDEIEDLEEKTDRQLRIAELLQTHSKKSGLVVMSLPMPRKGEVSAVVYMSWLEIMTKDMPPFMFVRGNHQPVLTFRA